MTKEELMVIIENHGKWLRGEDGGVRANLSGADLRGTNLRDADLRCANLSDAVLCCSDLSGADLSDSNLRDANLYGACLRGANMVGTNLYGAYLRCSDLSGTNLYGACLRDANLSDANLSDASLWSCTGERNRIKSISVSDAYPITYTSEILQIGCQRHKISEWFEFDDRRIAEMDGRKALSFWREWKDTIRMIIEKSPASEK